MDLRIGQRLVKPGTDSTLLALKHTQQLQHQLLLASLHQQQVEQLSHQHVRVRAGARRCKSRAQDHLPGGFLPFARVGRAPQSSAAARGEGEGRGLLSCSQASPASCQGWGGRVEASWAAGGREVQSATSPVLQEGARRVPAAWHLPPGICRPAWPALASGSAGTLQKSSLMALLAPRAAVPALQPFQAPPSWYRMQLGWAEPPGVAWTG